MSDRCRTSSVHDGGVRVIEVQERMVGPRQALVTVAGEVDHLSCDLLSSALVRTWEARPVAVAVDLRQVTFLDAGGLRILLLASGTARRRAVPLVLQAGPGQVTRLLTTVGLGGQLRSPAEVRDVLATTAPSARPGLRLVPPTDAEEDSRAPAVATPAVGPTLPGLRSVRLPRPAWGLRGLGEARASTTTVAARAAPGPAAARVFRRALRSRAPSTIEVAEELTDPRRH